MACFNRREKWSPFAGAGLAAVLGILIVPFIAAAVEWTAGPAVAVRNFQGSGPYDYMGKGLADMVVSDLVTLKPDNCNMAVVEWEKRAEIQKEIDLGQGPEFDPATRVKPGQWIDPQYFVEGSVSTTETTMSWSLQLRDIKTGRIVGKYNGSASGDAVLTSASEGIARRLIKKLCRKGKDYSGEPVDDQPGSSPASAAPSATPAPDNSPASQVNDVVNAIKGLFGK